MCAGLPPGSFSACAFLGFVDQFTAGVSGGIRGLEASRPFVTLNMPDVRIRIEYRAWFPRPRNKRCSSHFPRGRGICRTGVHISFLLT